MILSQILAASENLALGKENKLLWHHSEDLKYFKEKTSGKIIILGRKTFESFGKPLPKRFHIVISRTKPSVNFENVVFVSSIQEAYDWALKLIAEKQWPEEVMIVGGAEIYKQTLKDCEFIYLTRVPGSFEADAFYTDDYKKLFTKTLSQKSPTTPDLVYEVWSKNKIIS